MKNSRLALPCSAGPIPEAFQPPNGKSTAALAVEQLTLRIPARTRWRKSSIRFGEVVKMAATKPCFTPLQSKIASSQSPARCTTSTGPNVSSWTISAFGSSQHTMVGSSHALPRASFDFSERLITRNAAARARSITASTRLRDAEEMSGPICVFSSAGSPQTRRRDARTN